jgi:hypothetical protein
MALALLTVIVLAMLVAIAAMASMWINGFRARDASCLPTPSVVTASYNSKNLRIFVACFLVALAAMITLMMYIHP